MYLSGVLDIRLAQKGNLFSGADVVISAIWRYWVSYTLYE